MRRAGLAGVPLQIVYGVIIVSVVLMGVAAWRWWPRGASSHLESTRIVAAPGQPSGSVPEKDGAVSSKTEAEPGSSEVPPEVVVHVAGSVKRPGVYRLLPGQRVADAVEAAGGTRSDAALEAVNLARMLADGEQVIVPDKKSARQGARASVGTVVPGSGVPGSPGTANAGAPSALVNVNTADAALLDTLPGVGPSTATRIIADREANGPFATVEDLGRVSGIGPKRLEQLRPLVSVD